jgi:hypothetical protein
VEAPWKHGEAIEGKFQKTRKIGIASKYLLLNDFINISQSQENHRN